MPSGHKSLKTVNCEKVKTTIKYIREDAYRDASFKVASTHLETALSADHTEQDCGIIIK